MTIELKVTGDDITQFYTNLSNAFILLAQGGNVVFKPVPTGGVQTEAEAKAAAAAVQTATEVVAEENPSVAAPPKKRGPKPKPAPQTIEGTATEVNPTETPQDGGIPDFLKRDGETPPAAAAPTSLTLDDMRQRVKDILEKHKGRGHEMPECIAYVRKLFGPFKIKLAADLKPEQFAEFWQKSAAYIDGTAK